MYNLYIWQWNRKLSQHCLRLNSTPRCFRTRLEKKKNNFEKYLTVGELRKSVDLLNTLYSAGLFFKTRKMKLKHWKKKKFSVDIKGRHFRQLVWRRNAKREERGINYAQRREYIECCLQQLKRNLYRQQKTQFFKVKTFQYNSRGRREKKSNELPEHPATTTNGFYFSKWIQTGCQPRIKSIVRLPWREQKWISHEHSCESECNRLPRN